MTASLETSYDIDPGLTDLVLLACRRLQEHARVGEEASDLEGLERSLGKSIDAILFFGLHVSDGHSASPGLIVAIERLYELLLGIQRGLLVHELEASSLYVVASDVSEARAQRVSVLRTRTAHTIRELHNALLVAYGTLFDQAISG
ncbi:MAG: hypothetical protein U1E65_17190 [Myxococcota bacterium]